MVQQMVEDLITNVLSRNFLRLLRMNNLKRMGSFTSKPVQEAAESVDDEVEVPHAATHAELLDWIRKPLAGLPSLLTRTYRTAHGRSCETAELSFRVMQWNILAQALGTHADNFICCPSAALEWKTRRFRILEEILVHHPDILCLQEVDHFSLLQVVLETLGYKGFFVPKPDSPCIYLPDNNGPDGCAIFFREDRFALLRKHSRILEVWHVQSNQVALLVILKELNTGHEVAIITTHLKARQGALLSTLRNKQGDDLLIFLQENSTNQPAIICGDFNAEPLEPVYSTVIGSQQGFSSAYANLYGEEPPYSTWKIREDGEACHNIDYIFYTGSQLILEGGIDHPPEKEVGPNRLPSFRYPSDHFSLVCDFSFRPHRSLHDEQKGR